MLRLALAGILLIYALWALRRFFRAYNAGHKRPSPPPGAGALKGQSRPPRDLGRDEQTGEYRVKDK